MHVFRVMQWGLPEEAWDEDLPDHSVLILPVLKPGVREAFLGEEI
jgi:hypothetical protein